MHRTLDRRLAALERQADPPTEDETIIIVAYEDGHPDDPNPSPFNVPGGIQPRPGIRVVDYRQGLEALAPREMRDGYAAGDT